ncbi:MAG: S8 family serine peptidase [Microcoleus sp. SU_5_6]|nr:S8 family serine peptidase [Microcoleus sp. SU_5_6]
MPEVKFGNKNEPAVRFEKSEDLIAIRTRSKRSATAVAVPTAVSAHLSGGQLVLSFPEVGVEVYRVPTGGGHRSVNDRKIALRQLPDVRFAGGVLVDEQSKEPVIYTENLFVKFTDATEPDECKRIIREAGLTIKEEVSYATNAFFVAAPEGTGERVFEIALSLLNRDDVEYCHPEIVRKRSLRAIAPQQWHLKTTTINGITISASANVEAAYQITQGEGITIAVIDDGVDIDHVEFSSLAKIVAPRDATQNSNDPRPKDDRPFPDDHGTACAGVACADGKSEASGVASKAKLMPIRLASGLGSQQEANAFRWAADNGADVISCSWGPQDGEWFNPNDPQHNSNVPLPASTKLAIDYATARGRGGKGCVVLFAAGNGNESVDNDGYASYDRVIAVAACNDRGKRSIYSDFGKAIWCAFPSSDFGYPEFSHPEPLTTGIWTTDRTGNRGYNQGSLADGDAAGNHTNSFGGTSSSCPGAAGIAALVLAVNPNLRWQEVKDLLKQSCDKIDPAGGQYDANGWSKFYGYGRLNAMTAVTLAKPQPQNSVVIVRNFDRALPDLQTVSVQLEVAETNPVARLSVIVEILHSYIGDLIVSLTPPSELNLGKIVLHNRSGGATRNLKKTFDALTLPALADFQGKTVKGTWQLEVQDMAVRDEGQLVKFGIELFFV